MLERLSDYFNKEYLTKYFEEHLKTKKGGGRDNLSTFKYHKLLQQELPLIIKKCLDGTYSFSYYMEKLVLKGSGKLPRVLSIPTVRDRLVLGVLNKYLQSVYKDKIIQNIPNMYIKQIVDYLASTKKEVAFYKTDYHDFYGSIRIKLLKHKLLKDNIPPEVIKLILNAIKTPTIGIQVPKDIKPNERGIPQGLAMSNILASIYMQDFDNKFGKNVSELYIRYVDDTLYLTPTIKNIRLELTKKISKDKMGLRLANEKIAFGVIGKTNIDFIGYVIKSNSIISIRPKSVNRFLNRIANISTKCKTLHRNTSLRPPFISDDKDFYEYYISEFNECISGIRYNKHLYGWMAYFQAMTDISLLYGMDCIIKNKMLKDLPEEIRSNINSLVNTYFDIRKDCGEKYLKDFDKIKDIHDKWRLLVKRGRLNKDIVYSKEQINMAFDKYMGYKIRYIETNIGTIS